MTETKSALVDSSIVVEGLSVTYGAKRVLANIFLKINKGHIYGLVGPNGAGKSTLFKSILGLIDTGTGTIKINGRLRDKTDKSIAYVPQRDDVDWDFPAVVMDIVLMGRYPHKKIWQTLNRKDKEIATRALQDLEIEHLKNRQIGQLSGGQQQRVFIARALCQKAEIFLLDEPFVGVDIATENSIIRILKKLASEGKTLMVVHHDLSTVKTYFDKIVLLNQRLIAYGDTDEMFTQENIGKAYGAQLNILHQSGLVG